MLARLPKQELLTLAWALATMLRKFPTKQPYLAERGWISPLITTLTCSKRAHHSLNDIYMAAQPTAALAL